MTDGAQGLGENSGKCLVHSNESVIVVIITLVFTGCFNAPCNSVWLNLLWLVPASGEWEGCCTSLLREKERYRSFKLERDLYIINCIFSHPLLKRGV